MVLDLEINGITRTERCIRSQNNDDPRFRRDTGCAPSKSATAVKKKKGGGHSHKNGAVLVKLNLALKAQDSNKLF